MSKRTFRRHVAARVARLATLDLQVQPLIASADCSRFKEYVALREMRKQVYGSDVGTMILRHDLDALGSARSDVVLLAKLSCWLGF
jgi:hypothetical protein